tara:strand:- start:268 stop:675 length:408 start_codon:yes stop_codon:yes gene_type:complete
MAITQKLKTARLYKDFDMLFTKNTLSGDINKKLDVTAVKQSLMNLLLTKPYERPFHPELGSRLYGMLFEQMRPGMETTLSRGVEQQIANFEPRVQVVNVDCKANYDTNSYDLTLRFFVIGINEPQGLEVSLTRLR